MNFLRKNANEFQSGYTGYYLKPATCPHCGVGTDAVATAREIFAYSGSSNLLLSAAKCTGCHKTFFYANLRESGNSDAEMVCIYPDRKLDYKGFCAALETLIKDYAIDELGKPAEEVAVKNLYQVIAEYLLQKDLINTPDLIRILGDDYVHYEDRYPVHDLVILKGYMEIFLKQIEMQYMISHPEPVTVEG